MMNQYMDWMILSIILLVAGVYLYKTFKKLAQGCGSVCSGCSTACKTKIKSFSNKTFTLKQIYSAKN